MKKSYAGLILVIFAFFVARGEPLVTNYALNIAIDLGAIFLVAGLLHLILKSKDNENNPKNYSNHKKNSFVK